MRSATSSHVGTAAAGIEVEASEVALVLTPDTVAERRSHDDSVGRGTSISRESAVALIAFGPVIRTTIFFLNVSE